MLEKKMNAIEGVLSFLAAKREHRPQGYPFSKVTVYCVSQEDREFLSGVFKEYSFKSASQLESMVKLDFKKAGPVYGAKVKELAKDLSKVPEEFLKVSEKFPASDNTTKCRMFFIETEDEDMDELWDVITFKKAVKKYLTEDLNLNIVHPVFGGSTDVPYVTRVYITIVNCKEKLYQALEKYGEKVFLENPLVLRILPRHLLPEASEEDVIINETTIKLEY